MNHNYGNLFQEWEIKEATKLVYAFKRKNESLKKEDVEDLLQECLIEWFPVRNQYDPNRKGFRKRKVSQKTFMINVIKNRLIEIVRKKEADIRKVDYLSVSLNETTENDDKVSTLMDEVSKSKDISNVFLETGLKLGLAKASKKLTPQQKKLCRLLGKKGLSINAACKHFKKSRSHVYREAIRIRTVFKKAGLKGYLK